MKYTLVFLFFLNFTFSQKIDLSTARFSTGDNKIWSETKFDDSEWKTLKLNTNWENQGYDNYNGFGWYRIHFYLPSSLKKQSKLQEDLEFFLAKIDDADETFLNGLKIGSTGRMPEDPKGYSTEWKKERHYIINPNNPGLHWDADNVIAIRVYDDNGGGGVFGGEPNIHFLQAIDYIQMDAYAYPFEINDNSISKKIIFNNSNSKVLSGILTSTLKIDYKTIKESKQNITIPSKSSETVTLDFPKTDGATVLLSFKEKETQQNLQTTQELPYILTPKEKPSPKINNASVYACKTDAPFLYHISATGTRPMQYEVKNLPSGLQLDSKTGIILGKVSENGNYPIILKAKNSLGTDEKNINLIISKDQIIATPPMGWNSWNCWGLSVSDKKVRSSADALVISGLINHGWTYINIDDGWEAQKRAENGKILTNERFPDMKNLSDYLHNQGLKFGIYSSPGPTTCGGYLGSYEHNAQDAKSYADWGVDYLKYDWCSYSNIVQQKPTLEEFQAPYIWMHNELEKTGRNIVFSLCQYGWGNVWEWGHQVGGNVWRTTGDIEDNWESLKNIGFSQDIPASYNGTNYGFADPDMLTVGFVGWGESLHQTQLTPSEQYTQLSLWSLLSAPLMIGCDISKLDAFTYNLLSNDEVIAIDQDSAGKGAKKIIINDQLQVWVKNLADGSIAVGFFNTSDKSFKSNFQLKDIQLADHYLVRDLWRQKDLVNQQSITLDITKHGAMLFKITKNK